MFKRSSIRYGRTPQPETPYQRAALVWDERIGTARVQAQSWRYAFFGALGLSAALTGGQMLEQCYPESPKNSPSGASKKLSRQTFCD